MLTTFAVVSIRNRPEEAQQALSEALSEAQIADSETKLLAADKGGFVFRVQAPSGDGNRRKLKSLFGEFNLVSESAKEDDRQAAKIRRKIARLEEELARLREALGE
jgi:uncharacterized protein YceH (UPF0502 family)